MAFAYLYARPHQPYLFNPNENLRVYMTAAVLEDHTYAVDAATARFGPSAAGDAASHGGRTWSPKAPGTSLLGLPAYALLRGVLGRPPSLDEAVRALRLGASTLPALGFLYVLLRWLRTRIADIVIADAAFVSVALGSMLYGYALLFVSATTSAAAAFGAFMLLADARRDGAVSAPRAFVAGVLTAAVTWFEYPGLLASVTLALFALVALRPRGQWAPFALGAALPTLSTMHVQAVAFGSAFTPGHRFSVHPEYRATLRQGLFGLGSFSPHAAWKLVLNPGFGLLPMSPFLVFAPLGAAVMLRQRERRPEALCALALTASTWFAIASAANWRGGGTIGARYLALTVPFLAWMSAEGLSALAPRAPRTSHALALGTAAASVLVSGTLSAIYPHVPPEIARPLPELVGLLLRHGFVPSTAANVFGIDGLVTLAPLALAGALAVLVCARPHPRRPVVLACALAVCALAALPALWPSPSPEGLAAIARVTRLWSPPGHDRPAVLLHRIATNPHPPRDEMRALATLYREEGRAQEAATAERWAREGGVR